MRVAANPAAFTAVLVLHACAPLGPTSLTRGRPTYNAVINATEDEQILAMIVRHRYDETFGMLAVSGVTASLRAGATLGANVGIGPEDGYEGNLVPLSAEATFETNPVISYVPMRGEQFIQRMLSPVSAEQALLLSRMSTEEVEVLRVLVRRANGLVNPLYAAEGVSGDAAAFDRFLALYARLRDRGQLDVVRSRGEHLLLLHDFESSSEDVGELLEILGLRARQEDPFTIAVPLRFFVGTARGDGLDLETPSALEIIDAAGRGVDVPRAHLSARVVRPRDLEGSGFLRVRSSRDRPRDASVAVEHRDWWFYIDARDSRSKQAFLFLRTLIGLRLDEAASRKDVPTLTLPVGR